MMTRFSILAMLCILAFLFFLPVFQAWSLRQKKHAPSLILAEGCALMILLGGCGGSTASTVPSITPVTIPPGAGSATTSSGTSATSGSDWTTYHYDNLRTGYLPNQSDPQHLMSAWKTTLDGAVYAEPLVVPTNVIVATEGHSLYALDA